MEAAMDLKLLCSCEKLLCDGSCDGSGDGFEAAMLGFVKRESEKVSVFVIERK
ncbi:hypothetical protein L195_g061793 [Trifolium pratense]|uniref:Uncharacterized protein n=1 Tax=Trifolium pratense TaxID=57577 RepID=A0A2K3KC05_TRIPR|nr:hypothetical protein L195_g061793 [Trifolium pratense]